MRSHVLISGMKQSVFGLDGLANEGINEGVCELCKTSCVATIQYTATTW